MSASEITGECSSPSYYLIDHSKYLLGEIMATAKKQLLLLKQKRV